MNPAGHGRGLVACSLLVAAAASAQQPPPTRAPDIVPADSTLDIDPTERIDISGWWQSAKEIVWIKPDGAFVRWSQPNRFRAPSQSGRWDRQNYRTFWLEPYPTKRSDLEAPKRVRAALRRTDGKLFFDLSTSTGFARCDAPPKAPEDQFVGRWLGPGGLLTLAADGTYAVNANTNASGAPVVRAAHSGRWSFDGRSLILLPTGTEDEPVICTPADGDRIVGPLGELKRLPEPKSVPATGATSPPAAPAPSAPHR